MLEPPDTPAVNPWREAHETARTLHDALLALGIPETELTTMTARADAAGRPGVYMPRLSVGSVGRLLDAIGPALGPRGAHLAQPRPVL